MSREWAEGLDASYSRGGKVFSLACVKQSLKGEEDKWYITKVEALELLHLQVGHLPYQRIERMLQLGALTGINLDMKLLHQLVRQKCDMCIRAKATDSAHTRSLPLPDESQPICQLSLTPCPYMGTTTKWLS